MESFNSVVETFKEILDKKDDEICELAESKWNLELENSDLTKQIRNMEKQMEKARQMKKKKDEEFRRIVDLNFVISTKNYNLKVENEKLQLKLEKELMDNRQPGSDKLKEKQTESDDLDDFGAQLKPMTFKFKRTVNDYPEESNVTSADAENVKRKKMD